MKYLLFALPLISLVACQDSGTEPGPKTGYVAGYQLTCGLPWQAGNNIVVEKEFARDFLDGAIVCAREHPDQARRVLGLADEGQEMRVQDTEESVEMATEDTEQPESVAQEAVGQEESLALASHPARPAEAPDRTTKARARPAKAPAKSVKAAKRPAKTLAKPKPPAAPKKSVKTPEEKKAPATAAKESEKAAKAPAKAPKGPSAATTTAAATGAPVREATSVKEAKPAGKPATAPVTKPKVQTKSPQDTTGTQVRRKRQVGDYERFMGQF